MTALLPPTVGAVAFNDVYPIHQNPAPMNTFTGFQPKASPNLFNELPVESNKWFAIYIRSRFEKKVKQTLERSRYHVFLPLVKEKRRWSDRLKTVEMPLLPGYLFVKTTVSELRQLLFFPGVVRIIAFEGKPCEVRESEINLLEMIVVHGFPVENMSRCCPGDQVRIVRGPLKGWEGKVSRTLGLNKVVFLFESIGQAISVEVGLGEVERV